MNFTFFLYLILCFCLSLLCRLFLIRRTAFTNEIMRQNAILNVFPMLSAKCLCQPKQREKLKKMMVLRKWSPAHPFFGVTQQNVWVWVCVYVQCAHALKQLNFFNFIYRKIIIIFIVLYYLHRISKEYIYFVSFVCLFVCVICRCWCRKLFRFFNVVVWSKFYLKNL